MCGDSFSGADVFIFGFWNSMRRIGDASAWSEMEGCIDMHGFLGT